MDGLVNSIFSNLNCTDRKYYPWGWGSKYAPRKILSRILKTELLPKFCNSAHLLIFDWSQKLCETSSFNRIFQCLWSIYRLHVISSYAISNAAISTGAISTGHTFSWSHFQPFTFSTVHASNCLTLRPPAMSTAAKSTYLSDIKVIQFFKDVAEEIY